MARVTVWPTDYSRMVFKFGSWYGLHMHQCLCFVIDVGQAYYDPDGNGGIVVS